MGHNLHLQIIVIFSPSVLMVEAYSVLE